MFAYKVYRNSLCFHENYPFIHCLGTISSAFTIFMKAARTGARNSSNSLWKLPRFQPAESVDDVCGAGIAY